MSIQETKKWFEAAVSAPTHENMNIQIGVHFEEFLEMLDNLAFANLAYEALADQATSALGELSNALKKGRCEAQIINPIEHLDALTDQIVTAVGCAHMAGMDIVGALDEVNRSNFSKFEDGKPVFNEHGKIAKGRDYKAPELAGFVQADAMLKEREK